MEIRIFGDPVLREKARPVEKIDRRLKLFVKSMIETMNEEKGVGLAANQLGILERVIVCNPGDGPRVFINPEVEEISEEREEMEEGCLSLPTVSVKISRPKRVKVRALDLKGKPFVVEAEGLFARILQHEIDHLNGRLIIDLASKEERKKALASLSEYFLKIQKDPTSLASR